MVDHVASACIGLAYKHLDHVSTLLPESLLRPSASQNYPKGTPRNSSIFLCFSQLRFPSPAAQSRSPSAFFQLTVLCV